MGRQKILGISHQPIFLDYEPVQCQSFMNLAQVESYLNIIWLA